MLYRQKQRGSCDSCNEAYGNSSSYNIAKKLETIVSNMDRVEVKFALSGYGIKWDKGMTTQQLKRRLNDEVLMLIGNSSGTSTEQAISEVSDGVRSALMPTPGKALSVAIMTAMYQSFSFILSPEDTPRSFFGLFRQPQPAQEGFLVMVQGLSRVLGQTAGTILGIPGTIFSLFYDSPEGGRNFTTAFARVRQAFNLQGQSNLEIAWNFLPAAKQALLVAVALYGMTYIVEAISKAVSVKKTYVERVVNTLMQTDLRNPDAKIYQQIKEVCNKKGQFACKMSNECEWKKCSVTEDCEMKCSVSMLNKLKYKTSKDDTIKTKISKEKRRLKK